MLGSYDQASVKLARKPRWRVFELVASIGLVALSACGSIQTVDRSAGGRSGGTTAGAGGTLGGENGAAGSHAFAGAAGGPSGTSGTAGQSGGTATDGGVIANCLGPCLATFFTPCARLGASCVSTTDGGVSASCYANGVKVIASQEGNTETTIYYAPNGTECYTAIKQGVTSETIQGADGTLLAQIALDETQTKLTIACYPNGPNGLPATATADLTSAACAGYTGGARTCTAGTCSQ